MTAAGRILLLALLLAGLPGCRQSPSAPDSLEERLLVGRVQQPHLLCEVLWQASASGNLKLAPRMLDHLESEDAGVRACAYHAIVEMTGEDPVGYRPYDSAEVRAERVRVWRQQITREQKSE